MPHPAPQGLLLTASSRQCAALLPALSLAFACAGDPTTPSALVHHDGPAAGVVDDVVAKVTVVPDSQMVLVGDQFRFTATARNRANEPLDRAIVWKVSNTSIASPVGPPLPAMTFKALRTGKTSIKATADDKSRFVKVVVRTVSGAKVVVTPAEATVEAGATVQFVATGLTRNGETAGVNVAWTTTGGAMSAAGVLTAGNEPGTYLVIATSSFGAADTSVVAVEGGDPDPDPEPAAELFLVPATATVPAGGGVRFEAYGRTADGDSVAVAVTYTATGGAIAADGQYTAGPDEGTYQVVAAAAGGLEDTAEVVITAAPLGRLVLVPNIAASRPGETTRFVASVFDAAGNPLSDPVSYAASCGAVSGAGVFSAPQGEPGPCVVTATAGAVADTTEVVMLRSEGIPLGINDLWSTATTTRATGSAPLTASREFFPASEMVAHIQAARSKGIRLLLVMTGGSHDKYKTDGVFDQAKWQTAMNKFDTQAIRDAVAAGVADGTIIGNSVMDEPQQSGTTVKDWGPPGTMTKARVDQLCAYVKNIFPTLPVGAGHDGNAFEPGNSYQVCEFFMPQYAARKGNVVPWRDANLAIADRDGLEVVFSLNLLDGGVQDKTGPLDCAGTGGLGTHGVNCRMTPENVVEWGSVLGPSACALLSWRYDATFMAKPENQAAFSELAIALAALPRRPCTAR